MANISQIQLPNGDLYNIRDTSKQEIVTASGILKGDGTGNVTAAVAGTDYQPPIENLDPNKMVYVNNSGNLAARPVVDNYTVVSALPTTNVDRNTVYLIPTAIDPRSGGEGITYTLSISGATITLTGSDSSTSSINLPLYDRTVD